jgi:hypothetical protein
MLQALPIRRRIMKLFIPALLILFSVNETMAQCGNYPTMKGVRKPNVGYGLGYYNGIIEYLPTDYVSQPSKTYPLIIFFAGLLGRGDGSSAATLCNLITDQQSQVGAPVPTHLLDQIERGTFGADVVPTVNGTSFIVIAVQYDAYATPFRYGNETHDLINDLVAAYRVDESRIYLTGISIGTNQAIDYVSSSVARAERIAAVAAPALCLNTAKATPGGAANIAAGGLAVWFTHCLSETGEDCGYTTPQGWVTAINANSPTIAPRFTTLRRWDTDPAPGGTTYPNLYNWCNFGFPHDAWSAQHSPNFNPTSAPGADVYEWFLQFQSASSLPVTMKSFTARLSNGKVYLRWVTSSEQDNAGFVIERAGANGAYANLTQIGGGGSTAGDKVYEYVDESPLTNLSFYRLKQQDLNGRFKHFEVRKVMNKSRYKSMILITPNPFTSDPSAFVTIDKRQRISVLLTDMSGRTLSTVNGTYEEGTTELSLPMGNLPRGVYFVKVKGENITETHKIIKQ